MDREAVLAAFDTQIRRSPEPDAPGELIELDGNVIRSVSAGDGWTGEFASLWGGGTLPAWRRRGVFRALVAYRADLAAARGFRYLRVDALPESRPILQRLGFVELAMTTPFKHPKGF